MESMPQTLKLRNDYVLIVSGIANNGPLVDSLGGIDHDLAARQIFGFGIGGCARQLFAQQETPSVLIEIRLVVRPTAINVVQIKAGSPVIDQGVRIVLLLQAAGRIKRQVVINELSEVRVR